MICDEQAPLIQWYMRNCPIPVTRYFRVIGQLNSKGEIIGCLGYDYWTGNSCEVHIVGRNPFITKEFIWAGFDYPFNKAKCKVIFGRIKSNNDKMLKLARQLGFVEIFTIPDVYPDADVVVFRMYRHECKWLEIDYERWRRHARATRLHGLAEAAR